MSSRWVSRQGSPVSHEECGEYVAVHIDGSGITHLLDPVSSEVLLFLAGTPRTAEEILAMVRTLLENPDISWPEVEEKVLGELAAFQMIEACR